MITKITCEEVKKFSSGDFKLCYIKKTKGNHYSEDSYEWEDFNDGYIHLTFFFTNCPIEDQWGDDWNDAPYEYNAGEPYDDNYIGDTHVEHHILKVDVTLKTDNGNGVPHYYHLPEDIAYNSPFSVQMINEGVIAWLYITSDSYENKIKNVVIHGGDDMLSVFDKLENYIVKK